MTKFLFPKSIVSRLILLSLLLLFILQVIIIYVFVSDINQNRKNIDIKLSLIKLISTIRIMEATDPKVYPDIINTKHSNGLFMQLTNEQVNFTKSENPLEAKIKEELIDHNDQIHIQSVTNISIDIENFYIPKEGEIIKFKNNKDLNNSTITNSEYEEDYDVDTKNQILNIIFGDKRNNLKVKYFGSIDLKNNQKLVFAKLEPPSLFPHISSKIIHTIIFTTVIGTIILYFLIKEITSPLKKLAIQADTLSRNYKSPPLPLEGPQEIKDLLLSFNRMQEQLATFIADRTRIVASISHDLKTPLTSLMLRVELMDECEDKQKLLHTIDTMTKMVKATLNFAKGDNNDEPTINIDLIKYISLVCDEYKENGHNVSLIPCSEKIELSYQESEFHRIIQNILDNSLQYGDQVSIHLSKKDEYIVIKIKDNGPGIPQDKLEEVFNPFVRLDQARNISNAHIGLGLSIVRNIILKHGGYINLENSEPHGLTVIMGFLK